ncbi:MAG: acetyl-CoA sensor PanZ family protein [Spongiibacteraceae bacterium]|nr:acetyl-CoA sensor PanZ family protein [Spongiibacteraceae bacterium]
MPVILEKMTKPSAQDSLDLIKIYQNDTERTIDECPEWINKQMAIGKHLFAGRFNGRLVACIWVTPSPKWWQLESLCVRDITRRRGVARQLLTLLTREALAKGVSLAIQNSPGCEIIQPLFQELGFTLSTSSTQGSVWQKNHQ